MLKQASVSGTTHLSKYTYPAFLKPQLWGRCSPSFFLPCAVLKHGHSQLLEIGFKMGWTLTYFGWKPLKLQWCQKKEDFEATSSVRILSTTGMLSLKDCVQKWSERRNLTFPPHGESNLSIFNLQPAYSFSWLTQELNKLKSKRVSNPGLDPTGFIFF